MAWMTVWVTTYALSRGIVKTDGDVRGDSSNMAMVRMPWNKTPEWVHGKHLHLTEGSAIARAEEMRTAALRAAEKRVCKLLAMDFNGGGDA